MREDIIRTKQIYAGRIVNLQVHEVRLPNGEIGMREAIQHQGAVAVVALDERQHVLMVRQFRLPADQIMLEIPAGLLEAGEDPAEAVIREMREETGYRPVGLQALGGVYVAPGYTSEYIHLFYADQLRHDPLALDADEFIQPLRVPLGDALAKIESGEISEAKTVVALLRVARRLGV